MSAGSSAPLFSPPPGPAWIALGLLLMIAGALSPAAPVVTAIAIIAMGTTEIVASRQPKSPSRAVIMLTHGTIYAMLYALFIVARLHLPATVLGSSLTPFTMLDLAMSILPMAIASRRVVACLRASVPSQL